MTNNNASEGGNFGKFLYDSGNKMPGAGNRKGISATEVDLFNDIPPSFETTITSSEDSTTNRSRINEQQIFSSSINNQKQSNHYHLLSHSREQSEPNIVHQDGNEEQLNSAIDRLLEKYAPE